jgi:hypothetical protein
MRKTFVTKFLSNRNSNGTATLAKVDVIYAISNYLSFAHTPRSQNITMPTWRGCETLFPKVPTRNQHLAEKYKMFLKTISIYSVHMRSATVCRRD